jgi:hypothetical protein
MRASTPFKVGESAHNITKQTKLTHSSKGVKGFYEHGQQQKRLRFVMKEIAKECKEVATNKNGLGVELKTKNFKAPSSKIRVVMHANKMAHL